MATEHSFTLGAAKCGCPQPVASRRIAALEQQLGVQLLVRNSRAVELSPQGARLLPLASELLGQADRILRLFDDERTSLTLAVPPGLDPRARAAIRRGLPDRTVVFVEDEPEGRTETADNGLVSLALLAAAPDDAEFRVSLGLAHHEVNARPRFYLEQLRRPVLERDLPARAVHILAEDDVPAIRDPLRAVCFAAGLRADQVRTATAAAEAWTGVFEHGDVIVATEAEAGREQVHWSPIDGLELSRGYRLEGAGDLDLPARNLLVARLAVGLGGDLAADRG